MSNDPPASPEGASDYQALARRADRSPRQSALSRWLEEMFDSLDAVPVRILDWRPIREAAEAAGVTGGSGQAPTTRLLADHWRRIKRKHRLTMVARAHVRPVMVPEPGTALVPVHQPDQPDQAVAVISPSPLSGAIRTYAPLPKPEALTKQQQLQEGEDELERVRAMLMAEDDRKAPRIY